MQERLNSFLLYLSIVGQIKKSKCSPELEFTLKRAEAQNLVNLKDGVYYSKTPNQFLV